MYLNTSRKIFLKVILLESIFLRSLNIFFSVSLPAKLECSVKAKDTGLRAKKPLHFLARHVIFLDRSLTVSGVTFP